MRLTFCYLFSIACIIVSCKAGSEDFCTIGHQYTTYDYNWLDNGQFVKQVWDDEGESPREKRLLIYNDKKQLISGYTIIAPYFGTIRTIRHDTIFVRMEYSSLDQDDKKKFNPATGLEHVKGLKYKFVFDFVKIVGSSCIMERVVDSFSVNKPDKTLFLFSKGMPVDTVNMKYFTISENMLDKINVKDGEVTNCAPFTFPDKTLLPKILAAL